MIYCSNCRQTNDDGTNFCRSCGHRLVLPQTQQLPLENPTAPRPYMWKTDEYQITPPAQKTQQLPLNNVTPPYNSTALSNPQNTHFVAGYRCPRCGTQNLPYITRQISTAGWITFAVLFVTTFIFFWIGLLLKEDVKVCPVCNYKFN